MLAILFIDMQYHNYNRNAESAVQRKPFLSPVMIDSDIHLDGEGVFLKKCNYYQNKKKIYTPSEWYEYLKKSYSSNYDGKAFTKNQEFFEKHLCMISESINDLSVTPLLSYEPLDRMKKLVDEILLLMKSPFNREKICMRLFALHNLPRAYLSNTTYYLIHHQSAVSPSIAMRYSDMSFKE